jgi:hypothetical protein
MSFLKQNAAIFKICKKVFLFFSYYFITQNLITIAILPIYSSWGIKFHCLSLIGNFIFLPFLTAYLILSFFIFIGFCFQSCSFSLVYLLKKLTEYWLSLMYWLSSTSPDISFAFLDNPGINYSLCWGMLVLFFTFLDIKTETIKKTLFASFLCLFFALFILKTQKTSITHKLIDQRNKKFLIRHAGKNNIFLFSLSEKKVIPKKDFLDYVIIPEIIKTFGITDPEIFYIKTKS